MRISDLQARFSSHTIGYSDHTRPTFSKQALPIAYSLGARVFEKHFTMDKNRRGNDHYHSFETQDTIDLIENLRLVRDALLFSEENYVTIQQDARQYARRGLYAKTNMQIGDVISESNVEALRPTYKPDGIEANGISRIIGKRLAADLSAGDPITEFHISNETN